MMQTSHPLSHSSHIINGSLFALMAFFFMAVFGILTKIACQAGNPIWVSFIAYTTATIGTAIFILPGGLTALKSAHYRLLIARAVIGTIASFLYMIAMHYIPIINATLLFNTAPIFIPFLTVFVLRIPIAKTIWYAVIVGFIGIIFIIKPNSTIFTDPGNLIALASGLSLAIAYLCMKYLTASETGLRIIFYYFCIGTIMQIPLLWFTNDYPSRETIYYASLSGIALMIAQLGLVKAYTYATAAEVGVYQYSSVVFVAIFDWLIWSKTQEFQR